MIEIISLWSRSSGWSDDDGLDVRFTGEEISKLTSDFELEPNNVQYDTTLGLNLLNPTFKQNNNSTMKTVLIPAAAFLAAATTVSAFNAEILEESVAESEVTLLHHSRHFPMIDEPNLFMHALEHFLSNGTTD